jgi:acetyltransferase-like isoleucine patch superfamily enzyme
MSNSVATRLLQSLYQWVKKDPTYELPDWFSVNVIVSELIQRGTMVVRGFVLQQRFRRSKGYLFVGKGVQISAHRMISVGRGVTLGDHITINAISKNGIIIGNNVTIRENSIIECTGVLRYPGEGLVIGDNSGIGWGGFIGAKGLIRIGDNVLMGPRVTIIAENHRFEDKDMPIREQGVERKGITIEDDCWLGAGCTVLDGVTIGRGSVVAAGCVVTKSVSPYSIVVGVPGRVIRQRGEAKKL